MRQIQQIQYSYDTGEVMLSGELKKQIYALSLLTNYRLTLTLAILIPAIFITMLAYLFLNQKHHVVKQTGTVTAFSKSSRGARSPAIYLFRVQEFKARFERSYEGFSRFAVNNLKDDIYEKSSQSFPYSLEQQLKPADQRQYSWYILSNDLARLNKADNILPYINLHKFNENSDVIFLYDLYTYVFDKYNMLIYLFFTFISTFVLLLMGIGIKSGKNTFWKIYGGVVMALFLILFII